jgi:hypothetical protein
MPKNHFHPSIIAILLLTCLGASVHAAPWWDNFPRVIGASTTNNAVAYSASAAMNGVANDPGWGPWFTYANDTGAGASNTCASFSRAGVVSLSYNECSGTPFAPIVELTWNSSLQRWTIAHQHWSWQLYGGGTVAWAGAWSWFDSFTNDLPANKTENSYFARPFTRMNPTYGGNPMTYPDGTIATGFLNGDVNATNPANSRVYDAGCAKDIYGNVQISYGYNSLASATNQQHTGEIWVPSDGRYSGLLTIHRDLACPLWTNFVSASTRTSAQFTSLQGSWTDNFSPWDSFMSGGPVSSGFGEWSVALFRNYLTNNFSTNQLYSFGVLATNAPLTAITNFDARVYFLTLASNKFGLATANLSDAAWDRAGWNTQQVWTAYKIFRRQNGSLNLSNYDHTVHAAAALGGQTNFALLVNDITPASFGWARGNFDLASTELSLGWNLTSGSRGFGIPGFGRLGPVCKAIREHGRSRFATIWLYNDGYVSALTNAGPVNAVFYEMLASHAIPKIDVGDTHYAGTPALQTNFLKFVAKIAAPAFGARLPVEEVGIYLSTSTILNTALPGDSSNFNGQYHQYSLWGWGTALSQLHYQYRIVPEWKLNAATLQTLKVLIIPNASVFDPVDVPALQSWVNNGGCLIVTGDSGSLLGESGNFATTNNPTLSSLTGVNSYSPMPAVAKTNFIGSGAVYYSSNNIGYTFYNASGASRSIQLSAFATVVSNAFSWVNTQPILASTNAPATVGLTLYTDTNSAKTFLDLNNLNVDTNTYVTTPSPIVDVTLARPAWLTNGLPAAAFVISPDGVSNVLALDVTATNLHLQLPSVTNYLSVILQPAPGFGAWAVDANGNWGNSNNWSSVIVPSGISSSAIFSNGITASRVVTNEITRTVGNLIFGDASPGSPAGWTLSGASGLTLQVSNGTPNIALGPLGAGASLTLAVPLAGNQGLAVNGVGNLNVTATNNYTGATTLGATPGGSLSVMINGGKISSAGTVTVQTNVTLGGNGVIVGAVSIQPGATLQPGLGGFDISTLSVSNSLTLAGSTIITLNRTNVQKAARVAGMSAVTYGGTLFLTNTGPSLQAGDVFTNFSAASYSGSFAGIFPTSPGAGLVWDTSKLLVNGSVAVAALPTVFILPAATNIALGASVTLTASAGGTMPLSYRWFDNATNFIAGATNSALPLTNPSPIAAGTYTVVVTNLFGAATNWATVGINPLFIFSITFSGGNFVVGSSGPDGNSCRVLTATNLNLPLTNWMPAVTGIFSGGEFWFTDSVSTNCLQRFYRLTVP